MPLSPNFGIVVRSCPAPTAPGRTV